MSTNTDFISLVPDGWIKDYLVEMQSAHNEMPMPFHFLSAAVVIGHILGYQAWATLAKNVKIYPTINAMLLSPAGKCRRGEGTKITTAVAKAGGVNVFSGKTTPEALIDELREQGKVLLYVEELSMLLSKQDFQVPIIPVLTKLLLHSGGSIDFRTRMHGKITLERPCLSALFTTAPDWFITTMPEAAFGGGMMSRFLVCCLEDREVYHIDIAADDDPDNTALKNLAKRLETIHVNYSGHIKGDKEAQQWVERWYRDNETRTMEDERHEPHRNRKPANLLRLAMVLGAAAEDPRLNVERLEQALALLDWMEPTLTRLYGMTEEMAATNGVAKGEKRILSLLGKHQTITHTQLARACSSYFKDGTRGLRSCLDGLIEKGLIQPEYKASIRAWPPKKWHARLPTRK